MPRIIREVYLDNNATTKVSEPVLKEMNRVLKSFYGNPSSLYKVGRKSAEIMEESRMRVAEAINADPREIYFTGSATEANNAILKSVTTCIYPQKKKIISTPIEHPSIIDSLEFLKKQGVNAEFCSVDNKGRIILNELENMIDDDTFLICCMYANNEIGTIQDIKEITALAKKHNAYVMSDCVQALGKIKIDVKDLNIDYASFSAHKLHGPKGVGFLYVKQDSPFMPFIHGGQQEGGMRAGTESIHNIAGAGAACQNVSEMLKKSDSIQNLKRYFVNELKKIKPGIIINSPDSNCLPNTVSITFPGIRNSVFIAMLDYYGISVSAGSACHTQDDRPSHVLKAIGLSDDDARQTIRFGLSTETTTGDMEYVIKVIRDYIENKQQLPVNIFTPAQVTEDILLDKNTYILDVRFWYDRKVLKSLPNSHEASFIFISRYVDQIPRDKNIIAICQMGYNAPIVAYYLKSKKFKNVGFMLTGLVGWKLYHPDLYDKYAGQNIVRL